MRATEKIGPSSPAEISRRRAMVVDQDEGFLALAAEALHSFHPGFDVVTAPDLQQAGEWLESFQPDLLLIGVDSNSSGCEKLPGNLGEAGEQTTTVLMLPEDGSAGENANSAGIKVRKPATLPELLSTVQGALKR